MQFTKLTHAHVHIADHTRNMRSLWFFLSVTFFLKLQSSSEGTYGNGLSKLESVFYVLFTAVGGDGQRDDCTSGFMSLERIRAVQRRGDLTDFAYTNLQAIIPGISFTCSGNISSWIFGAEWYGNTGSYTELQIWRSSGDGSYTKVGSTKIMTEENTTLYEYPLSSPLSFQEGDILGYYQPSRSRSQLGLKLQSYSGHELYYKNDDDSFVENPVSYHVLVTVETGEPQ